MFLKKNVLNILVKKNQYYDNDKIPKKIFNQAHIIISSTGYNNYIGNLLLNTKEVHYHTYYGLEFYLKTKS